MMVLWQVLSRKEIIQKSLDNYGYILVADTMDEAIDTVNEIASEHLEIVTKPIRLKYDKDQQCRSNLYRRVQQ